MRARLAAGLLVAVVAAAHAGPRCAAGPSYTSTVRQVERVAEVRALVASLKAPLRVAFGPPEDSPVVAAGRACGRSLAVYVDHGDRLEMWHVFFVDARPRGEVRVMDLDGDFVPLATWRRAARR